MMNEKIRDMIAPSTEATADQTSSANSRLKVLAIAGSMAFGLTACSSLGTTTYGTGVNQEAELLKDISSGFGLLGGEKKQEPIDYSARGGLVLPPKGAPMPSPQSSKKLASTAATNWPQDPDKLRKLYQERLANMNDQERAQLLAAIRKLPPEQRAYIVKNNPASTSFANSIKEPDYSTHVSPTEAKEYSRQVKERLALIKAHNGENSKGRKYLTQPPERVTSVSPEVQQELNKIAAGKEQEEKKGGIRKLWPF